MPRESSMEAEKNGSGKVLKRMCIYIYVYIYICMYACMHACMYLCMHVCIYIYNYIYLEREREFTGCTLEAHHDTYRLHTICARPGFALRDSVPASMQASTNSSQDLQANEGGFATTRDTTWDISLYNTTCRKSRVIAGGELYQSY